MKKGEEKFLAVLWPVKGAPVRIDALYESTYDCMCVYFCTHVSFLFY